MAENVMVTNEDILRFYADKFADGKHCPKTAEYLSKLKSKDEAKLKSDGESLHGNYRIMANRFKTEFAQKEGEGFYEDKEFYDWLKAKEIRSFYIFPDVFLEHTDYYDVALQKWHLYVAWYAYCESGILSGKKLDKEQLKASAENSNGILKCQIICKELLLWMCEAAGSMQTDSLYKKLIFIEEGKVKVTIQDWAKEVKEEIKRLIGESKQNS